MAQPVGWSGRLCGRGSEGVGTSSGSEGSGSSACVLGSDVGRGIEVPRSATWSLKCCHSVDTHAVARVLRFRSVRRPSLSEQVRKCGPRWCCDHRPVHNCPLFAILGWWNSMW